MTAPGRRLVPAMTLLLWTASLLSATTLRRQSFTCPLDGTKFEQPVVTSTNNFNGFDSDMCSWPRGAMVQPHLVKVCPKDFYAAVDSVFEQELPDEVKEKLKVALARWREKHTEVKSVDDLGAGQRWELAAVCAAVKHNDPAQMGYLWLHASWAQRQEGLRTLKVLIPDPISAYEVLGDVESDIEKSKKPEERLELRFQLAMCAHRAGDLSLRDKTIGELEKLELDEASKGRLAALKKSVEAESLYQKRARDAYARALDAEEGTPEDRATWTYFVADLDRRLGNYEEAV